MYILGYLVFSATIEQIAKEFSGYAQDDAAGEARSFR